MKRIRRTKVFPVVSLALGAACASPEPLGPTAPGAQAARRPETTMAADFARHDGLGFISEPLVSSCPGTAFADWHIEFGASGCLVFTPTGSSYALTDDIGMGAVGLNKDGRITSVLIWAHDVAGPAGIKHVTDNIPVAVPVVPTPVGFVLHVHADQVPVYRLSGHTGGKRVAMIGTISVWDVVYRAR